jgi:hypothetical protein
VIAKFLQNPGDPAESLQVLPRVLSEHEYRIRVLKDAFRPLPHLFEGAVRRLDAASYRA